LIEQGINTFDFLRGTERYKYHWTKNQRMNFTYYIGRKDYKGFGMWLKYFQDQRVRYGGRLVLEKYLSGDL
jgi:hypothetical protein